MQYRVLLLYGCNIMIIMLSKYICYCNMEAFVFQGFFLTFHFGCFYSEARYASQAMFVKMLFCAAFFLLEGLKTACIKPGGCALVFFCQGFGQVPGLFCYIIIIMLHGDCPGCVGMRSQGAAPMYGQNL